MIVVEEVEFIVWEGKVMLEKAVWSGFRYNSVGGDGSGGSVEWGCVGLSERGWKRR